MQVQPRPPCGGEILEKIGGNFRRHEEIALPRVHTDVPDGFPPDPSAHQRPEKIPVAGAVALKERGTQTYAGAVFVVQAAFLQVVRQVDEHFPLGIPVTAEGVQALHITKKVFCHLLLPGGEEAGVGGNILPLPGVDFVPELCQQRPVLGRLGDFFNVVSVHAITGNSIAYLFPGGKKFFLCLEKMWSIMRPIFIVCRGRQGCRPLCSLRVVHAAKR